MPVKKVNGYKCGRKGKATTKKKATKQCKAYYASKSKKKK